MSYAIYWYVGELGLRYAGRLELSDSSAELSGSALGRRFLDSISFEDIASVRLSAGRLRISRRNGAELEIGSVDGPGSLRELAEHLASVLRGADGDGLQPAASVVPSSRSISGKSGPALAHPRGSRPGAR